MRLDLRQLVLTPSSLSSYIQDMRRECTRGFFLVAYPIIRWSIFAILSLSWTTEQAWADTAGETDFSLSKFARLKSVGLRDVRWTEGFWARRVALVHKNMVPGIWQTLQLRGNGAWYGNLRIAAGLEKGEFVGRNWSDGDVYKWLEGAALAYADQPSAHLDQLLDEVIGVISKAQAQDGYLSTNVQLTHKKRWSEPRNHEMYNLGHLFTAAVIHYRATGKPSLLEVAKRSADYLYRLFHTRPAALAHFSAPSNLMGIVELFRATRDPRYLELAQILVDMRGTQPGGSDQFQDRVPLRKETQAVGHAMHATYLYATAADLVAETGEQALLDALTRLWRNVTEKKMYITGAVGPLDPGLSPRRDIVVEAFGKDYELPNRYGYNETCANIGNAMWNRRMLAVTGDARYADIMELVLYNSVLSGMSLDGSRFFYTNVHRRFGNELPLLRNESLERWSSTLEPGAAQSYCCPVNLLRTLMKTSQWAYGISRDGVWVQLYGSSTLSTTLPQGDTVQLVQHTDYPWSGKIRFEIHKAPVGEMGIMLRVPGWAENATISVNGRPWSTTASPGVFYSVRRRWLPGDKVELTLPMPVRLIESHPYNEFTRGQVAVMRGPVVYCLESPDLPPGVRVDEIRLSMNTPLETRWHEDLLGGLMTIEGEAQYRSHSNWNAFLYRAIRPVPSPTVHVRLIPYYAWANRGVTHMTVWIPAGD